MRILSIETSCDDTCVAVLEVKEKERPSFKILSNIVSSQVKLHAKYGGVYPMLAKREHQRNLAPVLKRALEEARLLKPNVKSQKSKLQLSVRNDLKNIDLIAVTTGPGLEPCLWVGVNFAKELAAKLNIPLIPVNHIEAHILVNFVDSNLKLPPVPNLRRAGKTHKLKAITFPAVCLVVSGGHTQLILMNNFGAYKIIGETRDDAAGECFDKTARILGLGYPGGQIIAAYAATKLKTKNEKVKIKLPRPMLHTKDYDFSFSGLKTAVLYSYQKSSIKNQDYTRAMCKEIQQAIIDVLIKKTMKAAADYKVKTIILGGGVTANQELKKQLEYKLNTINSPEKKSKISNEADKLILLVPPRELCTDNAAMIAVTAYFNQSKKTRDWKKIEADANLRIGKTV